MFEESASDEREVSSERFHHHRRRHHLMSPSSPRTRHLSFTVEVIFRTFCICRQHSRVQRETRVLVVRAERDLTSDTVNNRLRTHSRRESDRPRSFVVNTGRHAAEAPVNTVARRRHLGPGVPVAPTGGRQWY